MDNSLEIRIFKLEIVNFVNESTLPVEVKRLVFSEIIKEIECVTDKVINEQMNKQDEEAVADEQSVQQDSVGELPE